MKKHTTEKRISSFNFFLFCLGAPALLESDFVLDEKTRVTALNKTEAENLLSYLRTEKLNLTRADIALLERTKTVYKVEIQNKARMNHKALFEQFRILWDSVLKVKDQLELFSDCGVLILDLYQGRLILEPENIKKNSLPPMGKFLTIKAYEDKPSLLGQMKCVTLVTEGMTRFGIPELMLEQVPENLGSDSAYLIRTVAQFLLSKLQRSEFISMTSPPEGVVIEARFCEIDNPKFKSQRRKLVPVSLAPMENSTNNLLKLGAPREKLSNLYFEDSLDWLVASVEKLTEIRTEIEWSNKKEVVPA